MKRFILTAMLSVGALAPLAATAPAQAQMAQTTDRMQMPNGNVRTTTRDERPGGTATTRTVDRPDGTRTVVRRQTDLMGNTRTVRHDRGSHMRTVCRTHWEHGRRMRHCTKRYR
jgi:hypothetical protein